MLLWSSVIPVGHAIPIQEFTTLEGNSPTLQHKKTKELVFFWATWCGSCAQKLKEDLPLLDSLDDVAVITVNIDQSPQRALHFVKKREVSLPVWRDEKRFWQEKLKVQAVPHWAIFHKNPGNQGEWQLVHSETAFDFDKIKSYLK